MHNFTRWVKSMENWNGEQNPFPTSDEKAAEFDSHILEQPFWIDELLNEPKSPLHGRHRRSSSDSAALFELNSNNQISSPAESLQSNLSLSSTTTQPAPSNSKSKRSKQRSARNSRLQKLEYIAELETSLQILEAEESEISAELHFLNQQALILDMENQLLMKRLHSISQQQRIKYMEQEMLERELGRLRTLYQQQQQNNHQLSKSRQAEFNVSNLCI